MNLQATKYSKTITVLITMTYSQVSIKRWFLILKILRLQKIKIV